MLRSVARVAGLALLAIAANTTNVEAATLKVQPIQVCNDAGASCANSSRETYESFTDQIWAQAGINVEFLPWNTFHSTSYLSIDSNAEIDNLFLESAAVSMASVDPYTVSMWFVSSVVGSYGVAEFNAPRAIISDAIFSYNNPNFTGAPGQVNGRTDTIAHELGHNLGLDHCDQGPSPCNSTYVMAGGGIRSVAASLGQVGALDILSAGEISIAQQSSLLTSDVPEPGSITLFSTAAAGLLVLYRRRRAQK